MSASEGLHTRRPVVGVMGAGEDATAAALAAAEALGRVLAQRGWVVLSGGRDCGVMAAVSRGAAQVEGHLVVGILPDTGGSACNSLDLLIPTGLGQARNLINVLAADAVVVCGGGGPGTASEACHAIKAGKPLFLLQAPELWADFLRSLDQRVQVCSDIEPLLKALESLFKKTPRIEQR